MLRGLCPRNPYLTFGDFLTRINNPLPLPGVGHLLQCEPQVGISSGISDHSLGVWHQKSALRQGGRHEIVLSTNITFMGFGGHSGFKKLGVGGGLGLYTLVYYKGGHSSLWLGLSPTDTNMPNGPLMLQNCFIDFAVEHLFGCCTTEPGYAGDIGAIKIWLIDWLRWVGYELLVHKPTT